MIRYTLFILTVIGTAATAIAAAAPAAEGPASANVTVVYKNQAFPTVGPIAVEPCAKEDCSDVPSS